MLIEEGNDGDDESRKRALELIDDSAKMAAIKLKMMRAAFGAGKILGDDWSHNDLLSLCQPIADKNKIIITWSNPENRFFNLTEARLLLNLMLIIFEALPRGGEINISTKDVIEYRVSSHKLFFSDDKIGYLTGAQEIPLEPRYIGFYLLKLLVNNNHYSVQKNDNTLNIQIIF